MEQVLIRKVKSDDVQALVDIYAPYVLHSAITFEYEVPSVQQFASRVATISKEYPYYVALMDEEIVAYAYASTFKDRSAYQWSVEVSVYLVDKAKGKKIASQLYAKLEEDLLAMGIHNVYACITYPNDVSIRFHEKQGFQTIGHFHKCGFKHDQWWDMIWMEKHLKAHNKAPKAWKEEKK